MNELATKYGMLSGISSAEVYPDGSIKECILGEENSINTLYGALIPQYENDGVRRKYINSLSFYQNGNLKSISLQSQTDISTEVGTIPAELVTFYEDESIHRIFPLNGKMSGYWTEEDEYELAREFQFEFSFGTFKKKIICIQFYENGSIKSLTFWPKDTVTLQTPTGITETRVGIAVYPNGQIKSVEPVEPVPVDTCIGRIHAFDANAIGIHGDINSLNFYEDGRIKSLITSTDRIEAIDHDGNKKIFKPSYKPNLFNESIMDLVPLKIDFDDNKVMIDDGTEHEYSIDRCSFSITRVVKEAGSKCSGCSGCSACG